MSTYPSTSIDGLIEAARGRITRVRFAGLRTAASIELDLDGLTVLIGPNGVGKSSLVEGFELLQQVMTSDNLVRTLHEDHGGPTSLLTHGAQDIRLGVDVAIESNSISYEIVLGPVEDGLGLARETLRAEFGFLRRAGSFVTVGEPGVESRL